MITAIVQYRLPPSIDLAACAEHFRKIAPGFRAVPGLIRKQFIYAEDGWAGGVYLWKTRADAEAFYSGPWLAGIRDRKSTRLNSSHQIISYAVFCLKKKKPARRSLLAQFLVFDDPCELRRLVR